MYIGMKTPVMTLRIHRSTVTKDVEQGC
jgi:hypothetical protein